MKIIPTFKASLTFLELNRTFSRMVKGYNVCNSVNEFQSSFAKYVGVKDVIRVPSARWGLYYILKNLDIPAGSEIILSAFNYYAVPSAIVRAGMTPVFVDISKNNLNIDAHKIEEAITNKTKVIVATHLCGFMCDMESICNIARRYGLVIIEDCVQSFGAEYEKRKAGSIGDVAFFSFGVTKNFSILGNAIVTTNNDRLVAAIENDTIEIKETSFWDLSIQLIKAYDITLATSAFLFPVIYWIIRLFDKLNIDILDWIFRENERSMKRPPKFGLLNNVQAEIGLRQLGFLDGDTDLLIKKGLRIYNSLRRIEGVKVPVLVQKTKNIFTSCPVLVKNRDRVREYLLKCGIVTSFGFMRNCSNFELFSQFKRNCINAEKANCEIIYLPLFSSMEDREIDQIVYSIKQMIKKE